MILRNISDIFNIWNIKIFKCFKRASYNHFQINPYCVLSGLCFSIFPCIHTREIDIPFDWVGSLSWLGWIRSERPKLLKRLGLGSPIIGIYGTKGQRIFNFFLLLWYCFSVLFGRVGTHNFKVQEQMIVGLSAPQWWAHSVLSLLGPYGLVGHIFPTGPFVGFKFLAL